MTVQAPLQRDADLREQNARLKASLEKAAIDVANLQTELTAALRKNTALKTELDKLERRHTPTSEVEAVFDHFLAVVWSGKGRRPKLDGARQKLIRERLKDGFSVAELKTALGGLAAFPNVADKGRCAPGRGKRYADLQHALRDAATVERFLGYLEDSPEKAAPPVQRRAPRAEKRTGLDLADHLEFASGLFVKDLGHGRWSAQCPAHDDRDPSLSIKECEDGTVLVHCFAGCPTNAVVESIGWQMSMLRGRS